MDNGRQLLDYLQRISFGDVLAKDATMMSLAGLASDVNGSESEKQLYEALRHRFFSKPSQANDFDKCRSAIKLIVSLKDSSDFLAAFAEKHGIPPKYAGGVEGIDFFDEYFTNEKLCESFSDSAFVIEVGQAERLVKRLQQRYEIAVRDRSDDSCNEALREIAEERRGLHGFRFPGVDDLERGFASVLKENEGLRSQYLDRVRAWTEKSVAEYLSVARKFVGLAEKVREDEVLKRRWCVTVLDPIQSNFAIGQKKYERFVPKWDANSKVEGALEEVVRGDAYYDLSGPFYPNRLNRQQVERGDAGEATDFFRGVGINIAKGAVNDAVRDEGKEHFRKVLTARRYALAVVGVLNSLERVEMDGLENSRQALVDLGHYEDSARFLCICNALIDLADCRLRDGMLESENEQAYYMAAGRLEEASPDLLVKTKADEIRRCGKMVESGEVVIFGLILLVKKSFSTKYELTPRTREWVYDREKEGVTCDLRNYIPQAASNSCTSWIGDDGAEYVGASVIREYRDETWKYGGLQEVYMHEERKVIAVWIPERWAVRKIDYELGMVSLSPLDPLGKIVLDKKPQNGSFRYAKLRMSSSLLTSCVDGPRRALDPDLNHFDSRFDTNEQIHVIDLPCEYVPGVLKGDAGDKLALSCEVREKREEVRRDIRQAKAAKELEEKESKYQKTDYLMRPSKTLPVDPERHYDVMQAKDLLCSLRDYKDASAHLTKIEELSLNGMRRRSHEVGSR